MKDNNKNNLKNLAEDIVASYDARAKIIGEITEDTYKTLEEFKEKRQEMSSNLREVLTKFKSLRKKDFDVMMRDILLTQHKREENVKKMLAGFQEEESRVVEQLRKLLKKGEGIRIADFKKTLANIQKDQAIRGINVGEQVKTELAVMQNEVHKMLEEFKKEREATAEEWKKISPLLAKKKDL
ncbi:hypothetical protein KJ636_03090 [Patescibacteria group bacterium]|nr:hypothetical protein [Patescibacteria group bacterium]